MAVALSGILNKLFLTVGGVAVKEICELRFLDRARKSKMGTAAAVPEARKLGALRIVIISR